MEGHFIVTLFSFFQLQDVLDAVGDGFQVEEVKLKYVLHHNTYTLDIDNLFSLVV